MENKNPQDVLAALLGAKNEDVRKKVPMKRFGIDFEIRALEPEEMTKITQRATRLVGKGQKVFNDELFNYLTIAKACVVPNWEDEKLLEAMGVHDAVEAIKKRLLFGEVAHLLSEIGSLNGFDQSDEEMIEEVKN
jgi:Phage XkdN-like tail assembly chaperone protein, TAC